MIYNDYYESQPNFDTQPEIKMQGYKLKKFTPHSYEREDGSTYKYYKFIFEDKFNKNGITFVVTRGAIMKFLEDFLEHAPHENEGSYEEFNR